MLIFVSVQDGELGISSWHCICLVDSVLFLSCHDGHLFVLNSVSLINLNLQTDQVDVRIKVLNVIKKLLVLQGKYFAREYPCVLNELLNRFSDKSAEVRLTALSSAKALYISNLSGRDSLETLFSKLP